MLRTLAGNHTVYRRFCGKTKRRAKCAPGWHFMMFAQTKNQVFVRVHLPRRIHGCGGGCLRPSLHLSHAKLQVKVLCRVDEMTTAIHRCNLQSAVCVTHSIHHVLNLCAIVLVWCRRGARGNRDGDSGWIGGYPGVRWQRKGLR